MTSNPRQLLDTLIEIGAITPDRRPAGLRVIYASRRERISIVRATDGPSFVVKRADEPAGQHRLAREAAIYAHLSQIERCGDAFLPPTIQHHADHGVLIIDYVDGVSLATLADTPERDSRPPMIALGHALSLLHRSDNNALEPSLARATPPWVLGIHRPSLEWYTRSSEASLRMRAIIQRYPSLASALDHLHDEWRTDTLIHADLKLEHVIDRRVRENRLPRIAIIDWESAQLGDAAWDIGSIFAGYLLRWVRSIPVVGNLDFAETTRLATFPIQRIQRPVSAFWQAYVEASALDPAGRHRLLVRATCSAAAIMIQREEEHLQSLSAPTSWTSRILQISLNMLNNPLAGATVLLGLDDGAGDEP